MAVALGPVGRCEFPMEGFAASFALVYMAAMASGGMDLMDMASSMERTDLAATLDLACLYVDHDFLCQYFFKKP